MSDYGFMLSAVICARCLSNLVDQNNRTPGGIKLMCYRCKHSAEVQGFIVGRIDVDEKAFRAAYDDSLVSLSEQELELAMQRDQDFRDGKL